jgi:hypothetical protein
VKQKSTPLKTISAVSLLCVFLVAIIGLPLIPELKTAGANRAQVPFSELLANPSFKVIPKQTYEIAIPKQVEIFETRFRVKSDQLRRTQ